MSLRVATKIARRELRGGIQGFRIFLLCLVLGVGAIAAVGTVRVSIEEGLREQGATLLGGDAEAGFANRFLDPEERSWLEAQSVEISEIIDFRSMVIVDREEGFETGLTQIKAVDDMYPLVGKVGLSPEMPLSSALAVADGVPGAVMQKILMDRLDLAIGDHFKLGAQEFRLSAALAHEPDSVGGGFGLGPRTIVGRTALDGSGLIQAGSFFSVNYRMILAESISLDVLKKHASEQFQNQGLRWRDSRNGAPGIKIFVERIGSFLIIVGLAGLAIGGVGVSAAVRAYLEGKTAVIATLKTLGADGRMIFQIYMIQIGILTLLGVGLGLVFGALLPVLVFGVISTQLPIPADIGIHIKPLVEAAVYGTLTAFLFTLWPLAKSRDIRASTLFRNAVGPLKAWPRWPYVIAVLFLSAVLVSVITWFSAIPMLALWAILGICLSLLILILAAIILRKVSGNLARSKLVRGKPALRLALGAIGGPTSEAVPVILSLGLGLTVLAAIGQIESNLRHVIARDLPTKAPSYFFIDIQKDQLDSFLGTVESNPQVTRVDTAPMLRGRITEINGVNAKEVAGDHWVIRGDRGITYADIPPNGARITQGTWWDEGYSGPALISFGQEQADEIGLVLGDEITVNILGRDITAKIANFRAVDFSSANINFVVTMNAAALSSAPHTSIATVYIEESSEAGLLRGLVKQFPNITAIRVKDAIERVTQGLNGIAAATSYGAIATLLTGFVVLIGAAAAGEPARTYEAAVLKTIGASRRRILASFMMRSLLLGAAAGFVALVAGAVAGWAVITFVMEASYQFEIVSAVTIVLGGSIATLLAGIAFAWRPLSARPAQVLRQNI